MSIICDNNNSCSLVSDFQKKFACALELKYLDWETLINHLSELSLSSCEEHIDLLLNSTVDHPSICQYPIKHSYQRAFLKQFITKIEDQNITHQRAYEKLIELLSKESEEVNVHFKHFIVKEKYISIKENTSIVSQGTTGLCTWQAGIALANWGIKNKELLAGKQILELGSGSGLTGLALIYGDVKPASYTFSDHHSAVLEQLKFNIQLNAENKSNSFPSSLKEAKVQVLNVDWANIQNANIESEFNPEIVLAADLVYDNSILPPLCEALNYLIKSKNAYGIIACTVRNEDTLKEFLSRIDSFGLKVKKDKAEFNSENINFYHPSGTPIEILIITDKW